MVPEMIPDAVIAEENFRQTYLAPVVCLSDE